MPSLWQPGQLLFAGFEGTEVPPPLGDLVSQGRIGGVVLFSRNVSSPEQLRALVSDLHAHAPDHAPLTVAVDQEGGRVQRLRAPWTEWPPMRELGRRGLHDETRRVAAALGRELADLRIDLDFAPVVDVDTNPDNPVIGDRAFSNDPDEVSRHAAAFIAGLQGAGVAACAKHFPGHGDTATDSHVDLPRVDCDLERLRQIELRPFRAAVGADVASMMTAHVLLPCLDPEQPATLSAAALDLLRKEIGYRGVVFSDDLEMAAVADRYTPEEMALAGLRVGVDAFLVCSRADTAERVLRALETAPDALVETALQRMVAFKQRFAGGRSARGGAPPYPEHQQLAARIR